MTERAPEPSTGARPAAADVEFDSVSARYPDAPTPALSDVTPSRPGRRGRRACSARTEPASRRSCASPRAFCRPTAGAVRIGGKDVAHDRAADARAAGGLRPAERGGCRSAFPVRDVVAMGRAPHQADWMRETLRGPRGHRRGHRPLRPRGPRGAPGRDPQRRRAAPRRRRAGPGAAAARAPARRARGLPRRAPSPELVRPARRGAPSATASPARWRCTISTPRRASRRRRAAARGRVVAAGAPEDVMTGAAAAATFDAAVGVGVHEPSGRRYFVPLSVAKPA